MKKRYFLIVAFIFLLSGCNKITKENYSNIKVGMSYDEVVQLIGEPKACSDIFRMSSCEWKNGDALINVKFISDKVSFVTGSSLK